MALLRPSMTLVLDLDERLASKDTIQEIKRCYPYVGTPVVRSHKPESTDAPICNVARMIVSLGARKYLHSADEGADELWDTVISRWVGNMLHKIGSTMKAFNTRQRSINLPEVIFDRLNIELQGGEFTVALKTDPQSFIDFDMHTYVDLARTLLNDGTLQNAVRVLIPSDASFEDQQDTEYAAWLETHPEPESEPQAAQEDTTTEEEAQPELSYEEWLELDKEAKSYENTAVPPTDSNTLPPIQREEKPPEPEQFTFEVDYAREWTVVFADGTKCVFNPTTRQFKA